MLPKPLLDSLIAGKKLADEVVQKTGGKLIQLVYGGLYGKKGTLDILICLSLFYFWCKQDIFSDVGDLVDLIGNY